MDEQVEAFACSICPVSSIWTYLSYFFDNMPFRGYAHSAAAAKTDSVRTAQVLAQPPQTHPSRPQPAMLAISKLSVKCNPQRYLTFVTTTVLKSAPSRRPAGSSSTWRAPRTFLPIRHGASVSASRTCRSGPKYKTSMGHFMKQVCTRAQSARKSPSPSVRTSLPINPQRRLEKVSATGMYSPEPLSPTESRKYEPDVDFVFRFPLAIAVLSAYIDAATIFNTADPKSATNSDGKINHTKGIKIFTENFGALSSPCYRRYYLIEASCVCSAFAIAIGPAQ